MLNTPSISSYERCSSPISSLWSYAGITPDSLYLSCASCSLRSPRTGHSTPAVSPEGCAEKDHLPWPSDYPVQPRKLLTLFGTSIHCRLMLSTGTPRMFSAKLFHSYSGHYSSLSGPSECQKTHVVYQPLHSVLYQLQRVHFSSSRYYSIF